MLSLAGLEAPCEFFVCCLCVGEALAQTSNLRLVRIPLTVVLCLELLQLLSQVAMVGLTCLEAPEELFSCTLHLRQAVAQARNLRQIPLLLTVELCRELLQPLGQVVVVGLARFEAPGEFFACRLHLVEVFAQPSHLRLVSIPLTLVLYLLLRQDDTLGLTVVETLLCGSECVLECLLLRLEVVVGPVQHRQCAPLALQVLLGCGELRVHLLLGRSRLRQLAFERLDVGLLTSTCVLHVDLLLGQ
mmetsp:Transcript_9046/g.22196  ORF Transcript_9046/g.22196 Transcript_9046/m.22196 type:complete len:245 (+) Transcript_9046:446-1180(+)